MDEIIKAGSYNERIPFEEIALRHSRIRRKLAALAPEADGLLLLGDVNIYYASGTMSAGGLWLPAEGKPVLFVRKGLERAKAETAIANVLPYRSYGELAALSRNAGSPLPEHGCIAVDMGYTTWAAANMLRSKLPSVNFVSGDAVIKRSRAVKTAWEIARMRQAGKIHEQCLCEDVPSVIRPGMNEWQIACKVHELYAARGNSGFVRLCPPGRVSLGRVSAGDSGLYPIAFDGPLGLRGLHPAVPYGGSRDIVWQRNQLLSIDTPCCFEGYVSDKTVTYYSGSSIPASLKAASACCAAIYHESQLQMYAGNTPSALWSLAKRIAEQYGQTDMFMGAGSERVRFLGHGLGLEMNEYPAIAEHFDEPFEEGMTIALEPKIAVPGVGMVGMEDTFLVQQKSSVSLSGRASPLLAVDAADAS